MPSDVGAYRDYATDGMIKSGWKYIIANDMSKFRIWDDGTVFPSKYYNYAFYFEHLGNNRYYIRGPYGGYLSYEGKLGHGAKIILSDKPCKWFLQSEYWHPAVYYYLSPDEDHNYTLYSSGTSEASETMNNKVILFGYTKSDPMQKFDITSSVDEHSIPQWWFDMLDGKAAPSGDLRDLDSGDDDEFMYYDKQDFVEETKLPVTGVSVNYNIELCSYNDGYISSTADIVKRVLLSKNERGTYLEAFADGEYVNITKYGPSGDFRGSMPIKYELPIFGAVFSGKDYNYIAYGNMNKEENSSKESIRIVKYSKEWKRISSVSLKGGKTKAIVPFHASSARFAENGNQLILHTGRLRFKSSDGLNHQSNLSVYINTATMKVTYVSALFPENHVSHSFDAYVRFDGNTAVFLDLGDGSPRSVVLQKAVGSSYIKATMYGIKGPKGAN